MPVTIATTNQAAQNLRNQALLMAKQERANELKRKVEAGEDLTEAETSELHGGDGGLTAKSLREMAKAKKEAVWKQAEENELRSSGGPR